ncbi:MAG: hypothetical protein R3B06_04305 [Kofleriaceae bacterium]
MRSYVLALALAACGTGGPAPGPSTAAGPRPVRSLVQVARYPRLAVPVAFAGDGVGWVGQAGYQVVLYRGDAEVRRVLIGELATAEFLDADGAATFGGRAWGPRSGEFEFTGPASTSSDGRVGVVYEYNAPTACTCDHHGSDRHDGQLVRFTGDGERTRAQVLARYPSGAELQVAAAPASVAAVAGRTLSVWPATGDAPAVEVELAVGSVQSLRWAGDRYLVAVQAVADEHDQVVVFDRDAGFAPRWTWQVDGSVRELRVRPDTDELALATARGVTVVALDGARRATVTTTGTPASLAWSPRGDQLLVATTGAAAGAQAVLRFDVR